MRNKIDIPEKKLKKLCDDGYTPAKLAEYFHCTKSTIYQHLHNIGYYHFRDSWGDIDWHGQRDDLQGLLDAGHTIEECSEILGIPAKILKKVKA